jgi:aspartate 1-decarboxylase
MAITMNGTSGIVTPTVQTGGVSTNLYPLVSGTAVATTSGTAINFTDIPSWVKRITVMLSSVSTNGTSAIQIQLGDSGGIETSSYLGIVNNINGVTNTNFTSGFLLITGTAAAAVLQGQMVISLFGSNTWSEMSLSCRSDAASFFEGCGTKTLSDTLTQLRITTVNGTDTFDAGSINIMYE